MKHPDLAPSSYRWRTILLLALLGAAACGLPDELKNRCGRPDDCLRGYSCQGGHCATLAGPDAERPDAPARDAGPPDINAGHAGLPDTGPVVADAGSAVPPTPGDAGAGPDAGMAEGSAASAGGAAARDP